MFGDWLTASAILLCELWHGMIFMLAGVSALELAWSATCSRRKLGRSTTFSHYDCTLCFIEAFSATFSISFLR